MKMNTKKLIVLGLALILVYSLGFARVGVDRPFRALNKKVTVEYVLYDANQIRCYIGNEGDIVSYHVTGDAGLEWPKGSGNTAVFQSGVWVIGTVGGEIRSAAVEYTSEYLPGTVEYDPSAATPSPGIPNNPSDPRYQVYSINKGDVTDNTSPNYNREYALWPIDDGAPAHDGEYFTDTNGNGVWDSGEEYEDYNLNGAYDGPDGQLVEGEDPPALVGDQMHWYVYNDFDAANHANLWNTAPLGLEVQTTVFGFNRSDPLGNVMFVKWLLINKSGNTIEDMYISMWSDSDVGDATDDYVGCDTSLSVGYTYNGKAVDSKYGIAVPAVGYDFFQGPAVPSPGDSALISGRVLYDFKNLPMTSFVSYINGGAIQDPENAEEAYNFMKGNLPDGTPFIDEDGNATKFLYTGDPVTGTGYIHSDDVPPGDVRFLMSTGPFTMETWVDDNGDGMPQVGEPGVQEIVGAIVIAAGTNNLNSITAMKFFDQYAQNAYDTQFQLPSPPQPEVKVSELDKQIILSWNNEKADATESYSYMGYNFEGYNIYQGESINGPWTLIATYDVVNNVTIIMDMGLDLETGLILEGPVQFGSDAGVQRIIDIRKDAIRGNQDLINGRKYYFAVTSYAYNPDKAPKTVESAKYPITVRPHEPPLGQELYTATNDLLTVSHPSGVGEAIIQATVVDPLQLTGEDYAVRFGWDSTSSEGYWYLGAVNSSGAMTDTIVAKSTVLDSFVTPFFDGLNVTVKDVTFDSPINFYKAEQTHNVIPTLTDSVTYPAISPGAVDTLALIDGDTVKVDTLCGTGKYYSDWAKVSNALGDFLRLYRVVQHDILIGGTANDLGAPTALAADLGLGGGTDDPVDLRADIELIFTETGQKATIWPVSTGYQPLDTHVNVPFEVWDVENNRQLCLGIADNNGDTTMYDPVESTLEDDWVVIIFQDYQTYQDTIQSIYNNPKTGWLFWFNPASKYSVGDTVHLYFLNPVAAGEDEFVFNAPAPDTALSKDEKKDQLKKINVFPNPYFGFNVEETNPIERFVTFTHLPEENAVIRIFSLGGQLVTKIEHTNGTSFETWDLRNQYGIPVASGMYIAHVEVEGVGSKILKLAIFMPEERLDLY